MPDTNGFKLIEVVGLELDLHVISLDKNVAEYYQQQVEMLEGFNEMDALVERGFIPGMSKEERDILARSETLDIRISNIANMILFAAKVYASSRSGSLAIIASTLDSLLDLLSDFILYFSAFSCQLQIHISIRSRKKDATTNLSASSQQANELPCYVLGVVQHP